MTSISDMKSGGVIIIDTTNRKNTIKTSLPMAFQIESQTVKPS